MVGSAAKGTDEEQGRWGLDRGHRFLEVGFGSGYGTAVAREIVGEEGLVVGVEIDPPANPRTESGRIATRLRWLLLPVVL